MILACLHPNRNILNDRQICSMNEVQLMFNKFRLDSQDKRFTAIIKDIFEKVTCIRSSLNIQNYQLI